MKENNKNLKNLFFDKSPLYIIIGLIIGSSIVYPLAQHIYYNYEYNHALKTLTPDCNVSIDATGEACIVLKKIEKEQYLSKYRTIEDCQQAEKKNLCIFLIAKKTNNASICYTELEGYNEKELCTYNLAVFQRNSSLCSNFNNDCKFECELNVNSTKMSDAQWTNSIIINNACFIESSETICAFKTCRGKLPFALSESPN